MKRTVLIIALFFFFLLVLSAQEVTLNGCINKSMLQIDTLNGMYQSKWYLDQIKVKINSTKTHKSEAENYNFAINYAANEQVDSMYFYLLKCIGKSSYYNNEILTVEDFDFLHRTSYWRKVVHRIDSVFISQNPGITNVKLAVELYHILIKDHCKHGFGLKCVDKSFVKTESENLRRVEQIIEQYGWPTFSMVGKASAEGVFTVIQHSNVNIQRKYFHQLVNAVKNEEASKESLTLLAGRISVSLKGMQVYGTQVFQDMDSITGKPRKYTYFPIRNELKVDSLRKSVDLIPLKQYYTHYLALIIKR